MLRPTSILLRVAAVAAVALLLAGCAAGRAYGRGEAAARVGDWDAAVEHYRRAVQEDPDRADFQIALERAMLSASIQHLDQARVFEVRGQLEDALREYRRASQFDPTNRQIAGKVSEMERRIRDLAEAQRPTPTIRQLQQAARQTPEPLLNPASGDPIDVVFNNASLRDILNSMGMSAGINVTYERDYQDRSYTIQLRGVTFEQALNQILAANQLFYKIINERTIMVIPDNAQKRALYEEQVIRTFFISHSDATELAQILNGIIRIPALAVAPQIVANKTNNTITVRASANIAAIIERLLQGICRDRSDADARYVDIQFRELMADPIGMVRRVYAATGDPLSAEAEQRMRAWIDANPRGKHGGHEYAAADFGIDVAERRAALRFYTARFDVPEDRVP